MKIDGGALQVLIIGASMILFSFFWKLIAARYKDTALGKGMAAVF